MQTQNTPQSVRDLGPEQIREFIGDQARLKARILTGGQQPSPMAGPATTETAAQRWSAHGSLGFAAAGVATLTGNFKLPDGRNLHFEGKGVALALGGGEAHAAITFDVPLEEVLRGEVEWTAAVEAFIGLHLGATWKRDGKEIAHFSGAGFGIGGGAGIGGGKFTIS